jgi:pilus assembly protein CpaE
MLRFHEAAVETETRLQPRRLRFDWSRAAAIGVLKACMGKWCRSETGVSAVEFALFAPILFFALVAAVDVGLAEYERMTIDHILRAGAQSAMVDQGQAQVLNVVQNTATKNFALSPTVSAGALMVSVSRFCACPESTGAATACSTTCAGSAPTFIYYRLSGTKIHAGMILPAITLSPSVQVQAR